MSATVLQSCLGADMLWLLPSAAVGWVQGWAAHTAASKQKSVGGIFLGLAQFVEAQGWESYADIFRLQVNKSVLAFTQTWQMDPHTPHVSNSVWFSMNLREVNNYLSPVISIHINVNMYSPQRVLHAFSKACETRVI